MFTFRPERRQAGPPLLVQPVAWPGWDCVIPFRSGKIPEPECQVISLRIRWIAKHFARIALDHKPTWGPVHVLSLSLSLPALPNKKAPLARGFSVGRRNPALLRLRPRRP